MRRLLAVTRLPSHVLIALIRLYQLLFSPFFRGSCRFHPGCSEYFIQAVKKYGPLTGSARGVWRILRCHPWAQGGYDPP